MRHPFVGLLGLLACVVLAVGVALPVAQRMGSGPVYTVAQVRAGLARDPGAWVGRTVQVHGVLTGCPSGTVCVGTFTCFIGGSCSAQGASGLELINAPGAPASTGLTVQWGSTDALLGFLRRIPLIGNLAPHAQRVSWTGATNYRVRIERVSGGSCRASSCYEVVLLDPSISAGAYALATGATRGPSILRLGMWLGTRIRPGTVPVIPPHFLSPQPLPWAVRGRVPAHTGILHLVHSLGYIPSPMQGSGHGVSPLTNPSALLKGLSTSGLHG